MQKPAQSRSLDGGGSVVWPCAVQEPTVSPDGFEQVSSEVQFELDAQPGTQAPDFTAASHVYSKLLLSSFKGRKTVVAFLPFAFTGG